VNECELPSFDCDQEATGLSMTTAAAVGRHGRVFAVVSGLIPGQAQVIRIA
jgi:hypothetical protein